MNEKLRYEVTVDGVQESNRELNTMGSNFEEVAKKAAVFATAIIGITKGFSLASESAKLFFQQQASENMVVQALKTTGNVAGVTTEQLKKAASELQNLSNFGDEQILSEVSNSLLTFKNIAGDTFMRTQQIVVDMAAKFGSLQNSAMQVGFALNDPIEGLTRLRRTGIQFTEDQQNLIKSLTETGRIAEAQAIVLSELETQFGGLAQATITPFVQIENAIGDMKESIGQAFAPMFKNFAMVANYLKDNEGLMRMFGNSLKIALGIGVGLVVTFTLKLKTLATVLATVKGLAGDWLSLLIGASAGIATTVALTADFTKEQEALADATEKSNAQLSDSKDVIDNIGTAIKNTKGEIEKTVKTSVVEFDILAMKIQNLSDIENKNETQTRLLSDAISKYNSQFGGLVGNIDDASVANDNLTESFKKVRESIVQQATLEAYYGKIKELASEIVSIETTDIPGYKKRLDALKQEQSELLKKKYTIDAITEQEAKAYESATEEQKKSFDKRVIDNRNYYAEKTRILEEIASLETAIAGGATEEQKKLMDELIAKAKEMASSIGDVFSNVDENDSTSYFNIEFSSSLEDFEKVLAEQERKTAEYYNSVKFLDDGYYEYRKANIMAQAEEWEKAGQNEVAIAEWVAEKLKELDGEKKESSTTATKDAVTGMTALYQQFQSSVQGMQFNFLEGWNSFTKSVLSSFRSMINQMISQLVTSGLLTFLASLANPTSAGIGLFGSIFGNPFKGAEMTPVGAGNTSTGVTIPNISSPSGTRSSNDNGMSAVVDKLNEVVIAVKEYGIADKIQVLGDVDIARRVERGNNRRSVL